VSRLNQNHSSIKKVAVIGAGISGLGCAYSLQKDIGMHVTLFEGGQHIGGIVIRLIFQ